MSKEVIQTTDSGMIILPDYPKDTEQLGEAVLLIQKVVEGIREETIFACNELWLDCALSSCPRPDKIKQCMRMGNFETFRSLIKDLIPHIVKNKKNA